MFSLSSLSFIGLSSGRVYKMQLDRFELFKSQELENGFFDVTFDIEGKKLHAHRFTIAGVSETMKAMLSSRWSNKDEDIKITSYSYDNFYEFLCFLYSGDCKITNKNIVQMIDLAEFYAVSILKEVCEDFLAMNFMITVENVGDVYEISQKYSLSKMDYILPAFIRSCYDAVLESDALLTYKKPFIQFLAQFVHFSTKENYFEAVYEWCEHQITEQQPPEGNNVNLLEAIKTEFYTVIPHPDFLSLSTSFLIDFVVKKGFILTPAEFKQLYTQNRRYSEEILFIYLFNLAKKQAQQKKILSGESDSFNVTKCIKEDLTEVISVMEFTKMNEGFLMDSVLANGIITKEQAQHVYDTRVIINNGGKSIIGVFKDEIGLRQAYDERKDPFNVIRCCKTIVRFAGKHFITPKSPSTVTKMKRIDWYLCIEENSVLSLKNYSAVRKSDYLLAEMNTEPGFKLSPNEMTHLTAIFNNIQDF